ncbi:MAG: alpha/beta hydrolase [Maribacter sp.]|uniref:alpha/beta hydrolase n=1 Tax=Maribacter sp. TaxID=1897614 RepID=UPI00329998B6
MSKKKYFQFLILLMLVIPKGLAQEELVYKKIDTTELVMEVYSPKSMDATKKYPAMVFFFGGGWKGGNIKQFEHHAKYFSKRGVVCFLVDYRVEARQKTTPFESLKDAKSAIRFVRANALKFQVDTERIVASGGSAGGHLAAATASIEAYNELTDDLTISCVPNALVLYNPVIDNGPGGYGYDRVGDAYKDFSPLHNIKKNVPPTIIFLGTADHLIPVETAKYYKTVMEKVGSRCELNLYEDEPHGFFNYTNFENYKKTLSSTDVFLQSLDYLSKTPEVGIE